MAVGLALIGAAFAVAGLLVYWTGEAWLDGDWNLADLGIPLGLASWVGFMRRWGRGGDSGYG